MFYLFNTITETCFDHLMKNAKIKLINNVKIFSLTLNLTSYSIKPAYVVTSIKQSPVLKGHISLIWS